MRVKIGRLRAKVVWIVGNLVRGNPEAVLALVAISFIGILALVVIYLAFVGSSKSAGASSSGGKPGPPLTISTGNSSRPDSQQEAPGPQIVVEAPPERGREEGSSASGTEKFAADPDGLSLEILGVSLIGDRLDVRGEVHPSKYPSDLEVRVSLPEGIAEEAATALIDADTSTWRVSFHPRGRLRAGEEMEVEAVLLGESGSIELHRTRRRIVVPQPGAGP
jgi:hypothetical protein